MGHAGDGVSYFVSLSPDGEHAAMVHEGSGSSVRLEFWNVADASREGAWSLEAGAVIDFLEWSPDSTTVAVAHWDGSSCCAITIVDRTGRVLANYEDDDMYFSGAAFTPDGSKLVVAQAGRTRPDPAADIPFLLDWSNDEVIKSFEGSMIEFLDIDDTGTRLLGTVLRGSTAEILDMDTGRSARRARRPHWRIDVGTVRTRFAAGPDDLGGRNSSALGRRHG